MIRKLTGLSIALFLMCPVFAQQRDLFGLGVSKGKIDNPEINEASGIVASVSHPGYFWVHNDSGDEARIFLIDSMGSYHATCYLYDTKARDWEDITMMTKGGKNYLVIGDIGDNQAQYPFVKIHLLEEPVIDLSWSDVDTILPALIKTYTFTYEDGPRDAESVFYDPIEDELYLITKRELQVGLYKAALPTSQQHQGVLQKVMTLPHTFVTAADMAADGSELLVKNLLQVFYWKRNPGESVVQMLSRPAIILPYFPEPQGEAITFSRDGKGYYTLSERALGMDAILYFYERK